MRMLRLRRLLGRFVRRRHVDHIVLRLTGWRGTVDAVHGGVIHGWVARPGRPSPTVELRLNGRPMGAARALAYRRDLEAVPGLDAHCGFALPILLPDDVQSGTVTVHLCAAHYPPLPGGRFSVQQARAMQGRQ